MTKEGDMDRTICSEHPPLDATYSNQQNRWIVDSITPGWTQLSAEIFYHQQDIDLSGYNREKLTFYPYSSFEQRGSISGAEFNASLTTQPYVYDTTIISSVPLNTADLSLAAATTAPGFTPRSETGLITGNPGRFDRSVIIHGQQRIYTIDSTLAVAGGFNTLREIDRLTYSSLEPTAADKLYSYRIIALVLTRGEGSRLTFPACRVLIPGVMDKEPKLEYMMRLKRSYELANQT